MTTKLFVGNISWGATEQDLANAFAQAGEVVSAKIITDRDSGRSKGFGFVEMATEDGAQAAKDQLDGFVLDGREIKVDFAQERAPRD